MLQGNSAGGTINRKHHKIRSILLLFSLGLISVTQVQLIGYLAIVEVAYVILALYFLFTHFSVLRKSQLWPFLLLICGWFFSAVITDIYRETELVLALKGCLTPILWANALIAMYFILRKRVVLMKWFVLGAGISGIISLFILKPAAIAGLEQINLISIDYNYRLLIGVITTIFWAMILFLYPRYSTLTLVVMISFGILSFMKGSRSSGAITLLATFLFFFRAYLYKINSGFGGDLRIGRVFKLVIIGLIAVISISEGYRYLVLDGWFGRDETQRYISQSMTKVGILGGRSEFASAMFAIADSPLLGHGSWAKDERGYRFMGAELLDMSINDLVGPGDLYIPTHSHLWGPWVSNGFLGFLFWFYALFFIIRFLIGFLSFNIRYLPFLLLFCINTLWDIIFSPVGFRPITASGFIFLILLSENLYKGKGAIRRNISTVGNREKQKSHPL
jgi:hypothetical protein